MIFKKNLVNLIDDEELSGTQASPSSSGFEDYKKSIQESLAQKEYYSPYFSSEEPEEVVKSAEERAKEIENEGREQDIKLKKLTLVLLFIFLGAETIAIFSYSFFQAIGWKGFHLEEWSFKLLVTATILQITAMLAIAVKHLFPNSKA